LVAGSNGFIRFGATSLPASIILRRKSAACLPASGIPRVQVRQFEWFLSSQPRRLHQHLDRRQPMIADTLGIYFDTIGSDTSLRLDAGKEAPSAATGACERCGRSPRYTTKRFISSSRESKPAARRIGEVSITGYRRVATYFETLTEHSDPKAGLYSRSAMRRPVDCRRAGKIAPITINTAGRTS